MENLEEQITNLPAIKEGNLKLIDTEGKKTQYDSNSVITSSSEDSENESCKKRKKRYDIEFHSYSRSKSTSSLYKNRSFSENCPVVREEIEETDANEDQNTIRFKQLNTMIQKEGYDQIEENLSEHRPKKYTKSTKALSLMDPVEEVKEEIDFNSLKVAHFKKLKCLMDFEEDSKIRGNTAMFHFHNKYETEEAIEEDNRENEIEVTSKRKGYAHTHSIKKLTDFVDLSDMLAEQQCPQNIIEEAIKEDPEHEEPEEIVITNTKRKQRIICI